MNKTAETKQVASHTPGPWGRDGFVIFNPASALRKGAKDFLGAQLAVVGGLGTKNEAEQLANALLIWAAPDLLEACQLAIENMHPGYSRVQRKLVEAVTKATALPPISVRTKP